MDIKDFPLAWRWTSGAHAEFPLEILETLRPLEPGAADLLLQQLPKFLNLDVIEHAPGKSPDATAKWLESLPVRNDSVTLVWDSKTALTAPWSIFVKYWDDFCYPSSDDIEIFVGSAEQLLTWHHHEMFEFRNLAQ